MGKNKIVLAILMMFISTSILCSCAETPDEVIENINILNSTSTREIEIVDYTTGKTANNDNSNITIVERGNITDIRNQLEYDVEKSYSNMVIKNTRVGNGDIMPTYDIKINGKGYSGFEDVVGYIYKNKFDVTNQSLYTETEQYSPVYPKYPVTFEPGNYAGDGVRGPNTYFYGMKAFIPDKNADISLSTYVYSIGNVWGSEVGAYGNENYFYESSKNIVEKYNLQYEVIPSDLEYVMETSGETWNALESITYIENFWNTYLSFNDIENFEYKVKEFYVIKLNLGYGYLYNVQHSDKNGNYYETNMFLRQDDECIQSRNPFMVENVGMTWCIGKEQLTRFVKDFKYEYLEETNSGNELLTLGAAADILSEALASNIALNIESAELNYAIVCKDYPYFELWEDPYYLQDICYDKCDFEIRPYWCFRPAQNSFIDMNEIEIYFVDAVTSQIKIMLPNTREVITK